MKVQIVCDTISKLIEKSINAYLDCKKIRMNILVIYGICFMLYIICHISMCDVLISFICLIFKVAQNRQKIILHSRIIAILKENKTHYITFRLIKNIPSLTSFYV